MNYGAKTPNKNLFDLSYIRKYNPRTLTPNGEKMMYTLGTQLRIDYPTIFNKTYNHKRVSVYCSHDPYSQSSAIAVLMGQFNSSDNVIVHSGSEKDKLTLPPFEGFTIAENLNTSLPFGFKPFILNIENKQEDFMFINSLESVCPKAQRIVDEHKVKKVAVLNKRANELGDFLNKKGVDSRNYFNSMTYSSEQMFQFYDQLHSYYYETSELFKNMSLEEYKKLEIFSGMFRTANHYANWNTTRIFTTRIVENILEQLSNKVIDDDISHEFSLFAANQEVLMAFLSSMRRTSFECLNDRFQKDYESIYCLDPPEFGSSLIFELV